jgi:hypothetical protein
VTVGKYVQDLDVKHRAWGNKLIIISSLHTGPSCQPKLENMLYNGKKRLIRFDIISVESTIALAESISDQLLRGVWDSKSVYSRTTVQLHDV